MSPGHGEPLGAPANGSPWQQVERFQTILRHGHRFDDPGGTAPDAGAHRDAEPYWRAKRGSHDDGELSGLFLGGIGAPVVGRDLDGSFARWHLQNGYHLRQSIDSAFFALRWEEVACTGSREVADSTETADLERPAGSAREIPYGEPRTGYFRLASAAGSSASAGADVPASPPGSAPSTGRSATGPATRSPTVHRTVYSLFPVIHEHYRGDELPLEVVAEFWTPLFNEFQGHSTASWPVWFATITVVNRGTCDLNIDTAAFWPNVLGWRAAHATALDQPLRPWPGQSHAGNTASIVDENAADTAFGTAPHPQQPDDPHRTVGALQQRRPERPVHHDMEGQILVSTTGPATDRTSVEACVKAGINAIDRPPERQGHTVPWAEEQFRRTGALPGTGETWTAHWDEALASAVHRGFALAPGTSRSVTYTITADLPIVEFGEGRRWYRKHTAFFGTAGRNALEITTAARRDHERWRRAVAEFHRLVLRGPLASAVMGGTLAADTSTPGRDSIPTAATSGPTDADPSLTAAMINELSFITAGGAVWVDRWARELDSDTLPEPRLGPGEHAGLLEGYDIGYYYYNTTDLWTYAWYAVARWWPEFARVIFDDLLQTIPMEMPEERIYYRTEARGPLLIVGKLPHDVGAVMEDPWHALNGYQNRDDSNLWKDHNPAFIVSYHLFLQTGAGQTGLGQTGAGQADAGRTYRGRSAATDTTSSAALTPEAWEIMRSAGEFILARTSPESGLPVHDEFGDSTWDNLGIRGRGSYSGSVTLAALAVLAKWAEEFGRKQFSAECLQRVETGTREYVRRLWTGEYFRLCDEGRYTESLTADALIGFYLADLAGFPELSDAIGRERIASHMRAVVRYNHLQYHQGTVGPLLVAAPDRTQYQGDGGDELQVNEVLVGSAWIAVAMLRHYGLHTEAQQMSGALATTLHGGDRNGRGLQFRTPAALDGTGRFRAPLNMRPLSIWFLGWNAAPRAQQQD
ncbi:MAG: GH116 family glycosyl hydrolase [Alkalispirochaeta sp.]